MNEGKAKEEEEEEAKMLRMIHYFNSKVSI
jgi:hypothetical protein